MGRLQTARLENFIRRWGSIKGPGSVLSETLGDVFPVLDLENLTPESQLTAGWSLFSGFGTVVGVAAQLTAVQVRQSLPRGSIVVVDKIIVNSELTQNVTFGIDRGLQVVIISSQARDSRNADAVSATAQISGNANEGGAASGGILAVVAGVDREFEIPNALAVLGPGSAFTVVSSTVNSNLTVTFFGRHRIAEPSELSF